MTNNLSSNMLVWIDCEMTGLDLQLDELIEIAVIITDWSLTPIDDGIDIFIKPSPQAFENMGDFVRNMHVKSGVLDKLSGGVDIKTANDQVVKYITSFIKPDKTSILAGNSIWSDRKFLEKQMPSVLDLLHYRMIDVSTIKVIAQNLHPNIWQNFSKPYANHRAINDIKGSIAELKYYCDNLFVGKRS